MSKRIFLFVVGIVCIILTQSNANVSAQNITASKNSEINSQTQSDTEYRIKPKDVLNIIIFGVCIFTQTFKVDECGNLHLSLIGDIKAAGKTLPEFESDLIEKLKKRLKNPKVNITIAKKSDE